MRAVLFLTGGVGLLWSFFVLPTAWFISPAREASALIISEARFKPDVLRATLARLEAARQPVVEHPELSWTKTLIRLRLANEASLRVAPDDADRQVARAEHILTSMLSVNPASSFLWLMLYSVETTRNGFDLQNARHLEQSYSSGPNEGWVSLRRIQLALPILPLLGAVQQQRVISEFARIVDSEFTDQAVVLLTTVGWSHRDRLLGSLEQADIISRQALAKELSKAGFKLKIPGVDAEERPW